MTEDNKRRFTRVPFEVLVELTVAGEVHKADQIINLGVGGCLIPIETTFLPGTPCHVTIIMDPENPEARVRVEGNILRSRKGEAGIQFTRIDPDSLFHLRNIIRYNFPDTDQVEEEFRHHPGLF